MNLTINSNLKTEKLKSILKRHHLRPELYISHGLISFINTEEKEKNALRMLYYIELLQKILSALPQVKIVILKGLSLVSQLYDNQPYRPFTDLDLLVLSNQDQQNLDQYLLTIGFTKSVDLLSPHKIVYNKIKNNAELVIEVHTRLFSDLFYEPEIQYDKDLNAYTLAPNDQCLFLVYHLVYQHTFLKLMWLNDLYLLVEKYQLNLGILYQNSFALGLNRSFQFFLIALNKFYGVNINIKTSTFFSIILSTNFLIQPKRHFIRYFAIKTLSKKDIKTAFKYYFLWIKFFRIK